MECKVCGTSLQFEAHENSICFDCYCRMDLVVHEETLKKNGITSDEEE
jgi:transcription elongation factor Elf1